MCESGLLDHTSYSWAADDAGSKTPEEAADVIVSSIREGAKETIQLLERKNPARSLEFARMLEPSANFEMGTLVKSVDEGQVYFDQRDESDRLVARIVVERSGDNEYFVHDTYRCDEMVVADVEQYQQMVGNKGAAR